MQLNEELRMYTCLSIVRPCIFGLFTIFISISSVASVSCYVDIDSNTLRPTYYKDEQNPQTPADQVKPFKVDSEMSDIYSYKDSKGQAQFTTVHFKVMELVQLSEETNNCPADLPANGQYTTTRHQIFASKLQSWTNAPILGNGADGIAKQIAVWGVCHQFTKAQVCIGK